MFTVSRSLMRQSSWKYVPNCFIGRFAEAPGLLRDTPLIGPFLSLVRWV